MKTVNTVFLLFLMALACSGGRGDPTAPGGGGSLSPGAGRANEAVTRENLVLAFDEFFSFLFNTYRKAGALYADAYNPELPVRLTGNYNGHAIVRTNAPAISTIDSIIAIHMNVEYNSFFSETGTLFIRGKLDQNFERNTDIKLSAVGFFFNINGAVSFSGDYACTILFEDFKMALNKNAEKMTMSPLEPEPDIKINFGRITVYSGDAEAISFNPFFYNALEES